MRDTSSNRSTEPVQSEPTRVPTGVPGLDQVLHGGLPQSGITLVRGGPGTGKTVLGLQFLCQGAKSGEPGIFLSFEEDAGAIRRNALSLGLDIPRLEKQGLIKLCTPELPHHLVQSGEFDVTGMLAILEGQQEAIDAQRIVVDAADVVLRLFRDPFVRQSQLVALYRWLSQRSRTAMLTLKVPDQEFETDSRSEYLADCVLYLDSRVREQVATRRLRVIKYRGSAFMSNECPYVIQDGGLGLIPISASLLSPRAEEKVSTGVAGLDGILNGGYRRATTILVAGASGTGKSTLAITLALSAVERNERVVYVSLEESEASLIENMRSPGLDVQAALDSGLLRVVAELPEAMGVEEHLWRIVQAIENFQPEFLIIDPVSACRRIDSSDSALDFMVRLLSKCRESGITTLLLDQSPTGQTATALSGVEVSSIVDTLVLLEQEWLESSYRRRMLVLKSRGSRHSHHWHSFQITDAGIVVDFTSESLPGGDR